MSPPSQMVCRMPRALAAGVVLPLPAEDQQTIAALLGPNVVGRALPSEPIQDASLYFPLVERTHLYQVTSGKNAGTQQTLHVAKGQRPTGNPAWRFELSPTLVSFLNAAEGGDLTMPAVTDSGEGVVVVTTPEDRVQELETRAAALSVPSRPVGTTGGGRLRFRVNETVVIDEAVADAEVIWQTALGARLEGSS